MKNRILFILDYFCSWIAYFVFARLFFLLFQYTQTLELSFITLFKTFLYGLKLDISFVAYLSIIPMLCLLFSVFIHRKVIQSLVKWYTILTFLAIHFLLIVDAGLYQSWGIRLDATFLTYINTPKLMLASVTTFQLISGLVFWLFTATLILYWFSKRISKKASKIGKGKFWEAPLYLLFTAALIIPIRGGLQTIPINQSNVYFSESMFANHAAINFMWNFSNALTHQTVTKNPYQQFDAKFAKKTINTARSPLLKKSLDTILNTVKPNVILIIWESLPAKLVAPLGGEPNVTVHLNRLSKEGLLFTNFYANGDRTDKGLVAILSGYYPQPNTSIIKMPNKTRTLPMLPKRMMDLGYTTSFYYGGDLNFGNMNTYLRNGGITDFVDGNAFDKSDWNSKWGVHDHVFMERFAKDIAKEQTTPFFKIALTLTSHEPFEFPAMYKFGKDTEEQKFRSSHAYTDKVIGKFIDEAKQQPWWDNTLIVIMSDHGHAMPKHKGAYNSPKKFQIPMLWLGGALAKKGTTINSISSQVDFSYTLLDLLQGDNSDFRWSKNSFNPSKNNYAHYIFNKGFGTLDTNGLFVYDYVSNQVILEHGTYAKKLDTLGKAITQEAFQDFMERK